MSKKDIISDINEILHELRETSTPDLFIIVHKINRLLNDNKLFRDIFNSYKNDFKYFVKQHQIELNFIYNSISSLTDKLNIPQTEKNTIQYCDIYFQIGFLYSCLDKKTQELLKNDFKFESAFHLYYSVINYFYVLIEQTKEIRNQCAEFNKIILVLQEGMQKYSDFYLFDKYKNEDFDGCMPFLKKILKVSIINILKNTKKHIEENHPIAKIKVSYYEDSNKLMLNNYFIKLSPKEKEIIDNINKHAYSYTPFDFQIAPSTLSTLNKKIMKALSISGKKYLFIHTKNKKYLFNTEIYDITSLKIF